MFELTPFFYALMAAYFLLIVAAAWVFYDSYQPHRTQLLHAITEATGKRRESIELYRYYCAVMVLLYLLNILFGLLPFIPNTFRYVFGILSFIWALVGIFVILFYLLRVAYPKVPEGVEEPLPYHTRDLVEEMIDREETDSSIEE